MRDRGEAVPGYLRLGPGDGIRNDDYGVQASESWSEEEVDAAPADELEALRIEAGTPAWGKELDESILPAEAGLDETHVSFTKGCYPGQEPIARLHYRGRPNRRLRRLEVAAAKPGDEILLGDKAVGRVTSAVPGKALGYVRREVPDDAELEIAGKPPGYTDPRAPVAQGIERCPAEAEVASSNLAGRTYCEKPGIPTPGSTALTERKTGPGLRARSEGERHEDGRSLAGWVDLQLGGGHRPAVRGREVRDVRDPK